MLGTVCRCCSELQCFLMRLKQSTFLVSRALSQDPLPYLFRQPGDMVMSCDFFRHGIDLAPNAGFYLVRSNARTLQFYDYWMQSEAM